MRVEELRAGTPVNGKRVTGKRRGWDKGRATITVTYSVDGQEPEQVTYFVGQNVPGSPGLTAAVFMPAGAPRRFLDNQRSRRTFVADPEETAGERRERRTALLLAAA